MLLSLIDDAEQEQATASSSAITLHLPLSSSTDNVPATPSEDEDTTRQENDGVSTDGPIAAPSSESWRVTGGAKAAVSWIASATTLLASSVLPRSMSVSTSMVVDSSNVTHDKSGDANVVESANDANMSTNLLRYIKQLLLANLLSNLKGYFLAWRSTYFCYHISCYCLNVFVCF